MQEKDKEKIKIALVSPPLRATSGRLPLSLLSLAAYIEKYIKDTEVKIIDVKKDLLYKLSEERLEEIKKEVIKQIYQYEPKIVGFTALFCDVKDVNELANKTRELLPESIIVAGGVQPSFAPEEFLHKSSKIDYVVIGEGEKTFYELVMAIKKNKTKKEIKKINSLAWFSNGELRESKLRKETIKLDDLPILPYHKVDMEFYLRPQLVHIYRMLIAGVPIIGTRGCPGTCTFCTSKRLWERCSRRTLRSQSPKKFVDEIEFLVKNYKTDGFLFWDESFTYDKKRVIEICKEIIKRKLNIIWMCQTRAGMVDEEVLRWMKKAGCVVIEFGIESGSQEALDRMRKGISVEEAYKSIKLCNKVGLRVHTCFMINTPGETEEDLRKTFEMVSKIKVFTFNFAITLPIPGSEIFNQLREQFSPEDYDIISYPTDDVFRKDKRFRLSKHNLDLPNELKKISIYEPKIRKLTTHFYLPYIRKILTSKRKLDYFKELFFMARFMLYELVTGKKSVN